MLEFSCYKRDVIMNIDTIFLDTSFKNTTYCYYEFDQDPVNTILNELRLQEVQANFSKVIEKISLEAPWLEKDYEVSEHSFAIIEYCGLGKLYKETCEEFEEQLAQCFLENCKIDDDIAMIKELGSDGLLEYLDKILNESLDKLNIFFSKAINVNVIINKAEKKFNTYSCHEHVKVIQENAKKWIEELKTNDKGSASFKMLCGWFSWEALVRHNWTTNKMNQWSITQVLIGYYLSSRQETNISAAVLFGKVANKTLFRTNEELVDSYILELLFMGEFNHQTGARKPVIVICADEELENNLLPYTEGAKQVQNIISNSSVLKNKVFGFCPGFLILVNRKNPNQTPKIINVMKNYIESDIGKFKEYSVQM